MENWAIIYFLSWNTCGHEKLKIKTIWYLLINTHLIPSCLFIYSHYTTFSSSQGSLESVSIGEIKLSFRKSLVKLSFGVLSKDPKVQLLINDLEIVTRSSSQNKKTSKSAKPRSTGKGKWLVTSSMARLLSVSVADLMIKVTFLSCYFLFKISCGNAVCLLLIFLYINILVCLDLSRK
jgi:hypothetical protein